MTGRRPDEPVLRALELVGLFHPDVARFAGFAPAAVLPAGPRRLLDHASHMTVAMERFHGCPVSLEVVARRTDPAGRYVREILLRRPDGTTVQYGVVRLDLGRFASAVAAAIRTESAPLGRILLDAGVLCDVQDVCLLEVTVGPDLRPLLPGPPVTFGRVAEIGIGGEVAIELLEVVAPGTAG